MLFKSVAKGLPGGSERIPVGFGKVRLRSGFAALAGEMIGESTTVEGATLFTWMGQRFGYGLIPGYPDDLSTTSQDSKMNITRVGTQPSAKGPAEWFTGSVRIDPLFQPHAPARAVGASVTFEPGARTAWHTHPLGQTLLITAGCGWVQREGGPVEEVHPGDVVWFSPGERHWHGATATSAMTHVAIQEQLDGKAVDWEEQVSDEQYRR